MTIHNGSLVFQGLEVEKNPSKTYYKALMMSSSKKKLKKVIMACAECSERNYSTPKSQTKATERLELKKYCPRCANHTVHRETK